jgi:rSAM/selenodomain-associated transferase 2
METKLLSNAPPRVSVIVPCWNDGDALTSCLQTVRELDGIAEVIVADASSEASCARVAASMGARVVHCEQPNRGRQLNAGSSVASGEILLFQHVDTELTQKHIDAIRHALNGDGHVGGAFYRKFDRAHRMRQWLVPLVRWYNRRGGALYGDQSLFVRRDVFKQMGGFADIPLMEDVEFSRRLRRVGCVLLDPPVGSSARRHRKLGSLRVTLQNLMIMVLYRCGVSPARLHRWYYRSALK